MNDGPNTGHAILHSGTVGAVLTAATHACRGIAFSLGNANAVQTTVMELDEGHIRIEYTEIEPGGEPHEPDSDARLLAAGWATVTSLQPVCEAPGSLDELGFGALLGEVSAAS